MPGGVSRREEIRTLKRDHVIIVSSHELNLHVGPFPGGVSIPYNHTISSLFIGITRTCGEIPEHESKSILDPRIGKAHILTRDIWGGVSADQQSRQGNGGNEQLREHCGERAICGLWNDLRCGARNGWLAVPLT